MDDGKPAWRTCHTHTPYSSPSAPCLPAFLCELSCCSKLHLIFLRRQAKWQGMSTQDKHPERSQDLVSKAGQGARARACRVLVRHYQTCYKWQFFLHLHLLLLLSACVEYFLIKISSWSVFFGHSDFHNTIWKLNWREYRKIGRSHQVWPNKCDR